MRRFVHCSCALLTSLVTLGLATPLPAQTDWCSFFGQEGDDWLMAMKTDARGRVWICGQTTSQPVHITPSAFQTANAGGVDAFVACLDPTRPPAQQLVWATHLGGSADDMAYDLHVDAMGTRVVVVGGTASADFPIRGGWQRVHQGRRDGFVAVLDPAQTNAAQLLWSSYLAGSGDDFATSVDAPGGVPTIAGVTNSIDFQCTPGAFQTTNGGGADAFVVRLSANGATPVYATYLGGNANEGALTNTTPINLRVLQLGVDGLGRATIAGHTRSSNFPVTLGAHGVLGGSDLFVSRLDPWGASLVASTRIGGSNDDALRELRLDGRDAVVLAGQTMSLDFPCSANALQLVHGGNWDGVLVHLDLGTNRLGYATYLGAANEEICMDAVLEPSGTLVVAGHTWSSSFPTTVGAPRTLRLPSVGAADGVLLRIRPGPTSTLLQYSTHFGGSVQQTVIAIEPDGRGGVFAAGPTVSHDFPTTANAFDRTLQVREAWMAIHDMLPLTITRYGWATSPCGVPTHLQVSSQPRGGNAAFAVETHDAPPNSFGLLIIGQPLPAPWGPVRILNIDLFVTPWLLLPATPSSVGGFSSYPLPVPPGVGPSGQLGFQSVWVTPPACGSAPLTASNALRW